MIEIGLLPGENESGNVFAERLFRIPEKEQKEMYLRDMTFPLYEAIEQWRKGSLPREKFQRELQIYYPNYCFYTGLHSRR